MIHPTAEVSPGARIGQRTTVWHQAQVREGATIGEGCTLGKGVYVDREVRVGDNVKMENGAQLFHGSDLEDGTFIGPGAVLANDMYPRAITPDGRSKGDGDWQPGRVTIRRGASVGAGAVILPNIEVGAWAMIGAGAVVTRDVPAQALVTGNPARCVGYVCRCGRTLKPEQGGDWSCSICRTSYRFGECRQ